MVHFEKNLDVEKHYAYLIEFLDLLDRAGPQDFQVWLETEGCWCQFPCPGPQVKASCPQAATHTAQNTWHVGDCVDKWFPPYYQSVKSVTISV